MGGRGSSSGRLKGPFVDAYVKQNGRYDTKKFQNWISEKARQYETYVNPEGRITEQSFLDFVKSGGHVDKYRPVNMDLKEKMTANLSVKNANSRDVYWYPIKKGKSNNPRSIYYSTNATSDHIALMAKSNPKATIKQLYESDRGYDTEAWKVLKAYMNKGYGNQVASKHFGYGRTTYKVIPKENDGTYGPSNDTWIRTR